MAIYVRPHTEEDGRTLDAQAHLRTAPVRETEHAMIIWLSAQVSRSSAIAHRLGTRIGIRLAGANAVGIDRSESHVEHRHPNQRQSQKDQPNEPFSKATFHMNSSQRNANRRFLMTKQYVCTACLLFGMAGGITSAYISSPHIVRVAPVLFFLPHATMLITMICLAVYKIRFKSISGYCLAGFLISWLAVFVAVSYSAKFAAGL